MSDVARVCATHAWQRALGHGGSRDALCRTVVDPAPPAVWDANHASEVRAGTRAEIEEVLSRVDAALRPCRHRLFVVDPLTPPAFAARLALEGYRELDPTLQLVLAGPLRATPRRLDVRPVAGDEDWRALADLVRRDHLEGARTQAAALPEEVTRGIVAAYRKKEPAVRFFLAREDGADCAYGAAVLAPDRMGMVEDLFTVPERRRRGIATAIIARAVAHVREQGADAVLIGAHVSAEPKRLYAALGFEPVCLTREYVKHMEPRAAPGAGGG